MRPAQSEIGIRKSKFIQRLVLPVAC